MIRKSFDRLRGKKSSKQQQQQQQDEMAGIECKSVWLKAFLDEGMPGPEHFEIVTTTVDADKDTKEGDVVVRVKYMSVDPYLRGRIKTPAGSKDSGRQLMEGFVAGVVLESRDNEDWKEGDFFGASLPFSTVQVVDAKKSKGMWKLTGLVEEDKLSYGVGVLGMPGSTAYAGIAGVLRPEKEGETIFISAASGAVGSLAGQIAKNVYKLKTVGSCGGPDKCKLIKDQFCYDHAIDYRKINMSAPGGGKEELKEELRKAAPGGIDMYFENVGGVHFEAALESLAPGGRIAVCGAISQYNQKSATPNSINITQMIYTGQRVEGFVCFAWLTGAKGNFLKDMSSWLQDGLIPSVEETFYDGVDNWPVAFQSLFKDTHRNKGKVVVRI